MLRAAKTRDQRLDTQRSEFPFFVSAKKKKFLVLFLSFAPHVNWHCFLIDEAEKIKQHQVIIISHVHFKNVKVCYVLCVLFFQDIKFLSFFLAIREFLIDQDFEQT